MISPLFKEKEPVNPEISFQKFQIMHFFILFFAQKWFNKEHFNVNCFNICIVLRSVIVTGTSKGSFFMKNTQLTGSEAELK